VSQDPQQGAVTVLETPDEVHEAWGTARGGHNVLHLTQREPQRKITINRDAVAWWAETRD
jgi:hypothetical protein